MCSCCMKLNIPADLGTEVGVLVVSVDVLPTDDAVAVGRLLVGGGEGVTVDVVGPGRQESAEAMS